MVRDTATPECRVWDVLDDDRGGSRVGRIHEEVEGSTQGQPFFVASVFDRIGRGTATPEQASRSAEEAAAARTNRGRDLDEKYGSIEQALAGIEIHLSAGADRQ
jgi:hypothetical protein